MSKLDLAGRRRRERDRLLAEREAIDPATRESWRRLIDTHLERGFPGFAGRVLGLCWPIRSEYDARHLAHRLRARGTRTALPVVVARNQPLEFRAWTPGDEMVRGGLGIYSPAKRDLLQPDAVLLPMNGWDAEGYRLGYGAGYFDRTLAVMAKRPVVVGVSHEFARLDSIEPQDWDIPMDFVVTERGIYRRDDGRLAFLGAPPAGEASALASPVCYAAQIDSGYFSGRS